MAGRAKERLTEQTRRLIELVVLLDDQQMSDGDVDALTASVAAVGDAVAAQPAMPDLWGRPEDHVPVLNPVSGLVNPLAAPLVLFDGDTTSATATWGTAYEGPPGGLHGGFVAAAFDQLLGFTQRSTGVAGPTARLTVNYRKMTPLRTPIQYEAAVVEHEGRRITSRASATADGQLVADAEALFIVPRGEAGGVLS
jgi:acyl-coenzyme A thioesterase PaaI-like protein